jgi:hypothetical protein
VSGFLEAIVTLLPADAGGRSHPIAPRDGNYCPALRIARASVATLPIRFIEGPPWIAPGQDGRVVVEIEADPFDDGNLVSGCELELVEGARVVGIVTVVRLWRAAIVRGREVAR